MSSIACQGGAVFLGRARLLLYHESMVLLVEMYNLTTITTRSISPFAFSSDGIVNSIRIVVSVETSSVPDEVGIVASEGTGGAITERSHSLNSKMGVYQCQN